MPGALILIFVVIYLGICAGVITLQVLLSKQDSKWLGLILPITSFSISLVVIVSIAAFFAVQVTESEVQLIAVEDVLIVEDAFISDLDEMLEARRAAMSEAELAELREEMDAVIERLEAQEAFAAATEHAQSRNAPIVSITLTFLVLNIPTAILIAIYVACRGKHRKKRDLEMMSLQDLGY